MPVRISGLNKFSDISPVGIPIGIKNIFANHVL